MMALHYLAGAKRSFWYKNTPNKILLYSGFEKWWFYQSKSCDNSKGVAKKWRPSFYLAWGQNQMRAGYTFQKHEN